MLSGSKNIKANKEVLPEIESPSNSSQNSKKNAVKKKQQETSKDGTKKLVGDIGKGKDNCDDGDSNERILENEQIDKVEYTNPNVKQPIKNEAYKVNSSNVITLTPNEIKKQKDLALL
eukprot:519507_1